MVMVIRILAPPAPQFESTESILKALELRLHLQLRRIDLISVSER